MTTQLNFESRSVSYLLEQHGAMENDPVISIRLELSSAPQIYASDLSLINTSVWGMTIIQLSPSAIETAPSGQISYLNIDGKPTCSIKMYQSAQRYRELLEMFKGGHVSEITAVMDELSENADYSRTWNTAVHTVLPIDALCFEFSLPQSEA